MIISTMERKFLTVWQDHYIATPSAKAADTNPTDAKATTLAQKIISYLSGLYEYLSLHLEISSLKSTLNEANGLLTTLQQSIKPNSPAKQVETLNKLIDDEEKIVKTTETQLKTARTKLKNLKMPTF